MKHGRIIIGNACLYHTRQTCVSYGNGQGVYMLRYPPLIFLLVALLPGFAATAHAQVYKCTDSRNKIIYSDKPCATGNSQVIPNISPSADAQAPATNADGKSNLTLQMDDAVKSAIANDDLIRAQALATSKEQREWVAKARKEAALKLANANSTNPQAQKASSYECRQARANLERAASGNSDAGLLNAKTSLMQSACGEQYQASGYGTTPSPYLFYPYPNRQPYPGQFPGQYPGHYPGNHPPVHNNPPGITTQPYDRTIEPNFGSRFIYPQR